MKTNDGQHPAVTHALSFRAYLRVLVTLFAVGLFVSIVIWLTIPDRVLIENAPGIVILLFKRHDVMVLAFYLILIVVMYVSWRREWNIQSRLINSSGNWLLNRFGISLVTLMVLFVCAAGVKIVFDGFALSPDEFFVDFAAASISAAYLLSPLDPAWQTLATALQPGFMQISPDHSFWSPLWRPGNAMLVALFDTVGLGLWTHSVLASACLPLIAMIAQRLWPNYRAAPLLAVLLLALSPQFLVTGMTRYAMTAHLFFGLLWLVCFLRDDRKGHAAAALVGFFAVGIHHVHIHPLFVMPFMLTLLKDRRWRLAGFYACWYSLALAYWLFWRDIAEIIARGDSSVLGDVAYLSSTTSHYLLSHSLVDIFYWIVNFFRFIAWQNLALVILCLIGLMTIKNAERPVRNLAWAILLSLLPYLLLMPSQGHGWGYRFLHPLLGNFALIAVFGWISIESRISTKIRPRLITALISLALITAVIGLPLRLYQAYQFNRPFAQASNFIAQQKADLVILDHRHIWFGLDLVRNDPLLRNRPKVLAISFIRDEQLEILCAGRQTVLIGYPELQQFGMKTTIDDPAVLQTKRNALITKLSKAGCGPLIIRP